MFYKSDSGVNIIEFGTGDIEVCGTILKERNEVGCLYLIPQDPVPVGDWIDRSEENAAGLTDEDLGVHTRLIFTDPKSIDVVVEQLLEAKRLMSLPEGADVIAELSKTCNQHKEREMDKLYKAGVTLQGVLFIASATIVKETDKTYQLVYNGGYDTQNTFGYVQRWYKNRSDTFFTKVDAVKYFRETQRLRLVELNKELVQCKRLFEHSKGLLEVIE